MNPESAKSYLGSKTAAGNTVEWESVAEPASRCRRILVVDDNEFSAQTLTWAMEMYGYDVKTCFSGTAAVSVARDFKPEVVLLDIGMPVMNGFEVCRKIKQDPETSTAYVIAQTGWGDAGTRRQARESGFDHHLTKPLDISAIHALIERLKPADRT